MSWGNRPGVLSLLAVLFLAAVFSLPSQARADIFERVGSTYGVSPQLLRAIAQVESSFQPYAIGIRRIDGRPGAGEIRRLLGRVPLAEGPKWLGVFPYTFSQAQRLVSYLEQGGVSFDVGLCQLNNSTLRAYGLSPASVLKPEHNLAWAAYHLARLFARHGYGWEAVWRYNGRRDYAWKVRRYL